MKRKLILLMIFLVVFIGLCVLYLFYPNTQTGNVQFMYTFFTTIPAIAFLWLLSVNGVSNSYGKSFLLMTIGFWFWAIAEWIWYVLNFILNINPYPSIADFFFILPYPLFFLAIYIAYKSSGANILKTPKNVLVRDVLVGVFLSIAFIYLGIYKVYSPEVSNLENTLSVSYGVADLLLVLASLLTISMVREFKKSVFGKFWNTTMICFSFFLVADVLFAMYTENFLAGIKPYSHIDLLWVAGYLSMAYAVVDITLHLKAIHLSIRDESVEGVS